MLYQVIKSLDAIFFKTFVTRRKSNGSCIDTSESKFKRLYTFYSAINIGRGINGWLFELQLITKSLINLLRAVVS